MDAMKVLTFAALAIGLFHVGYSQQTCRRACRPGTVCRVFRVPCGRSVCPAREFCIRSFQTVPKPTTTTAPARAAARMMGLPGLSFDCSRRQCASGEYCRMTTGVCTSLPCIPVPVCRKIIQKEGECPAVSTQGATQNCTSECSVDNQCLSSKKCCMEGCKKVCREPQTPQMATVNAGFCPDFPNVTLTNCTADCQDDSTCADNQKCCKYGCTMRCVESLNTTEPEVKPLICPASIPLEDDTDCSINCRVDNDCTSVEKCCLSGCSMVCRSPLAIDPPPRVKEGYCPKTTLNEPCKRNCSVDTRCPGEQKCCELGCSKVCVDPDLPPVGATKVGNCPQATPAILISGCKENCRFDTTCPNDQKCCQYGCSSICRDPLSDNPQDADPRGVSTTTTSISTTTTPSPGQRPGSCPAVPTHITGVAKCRDQCSEDNGCPGGMKCCFFRCGKVCLAPERTVSTSGRDCGRNLCTSDASCPGNQVCITDECSSKCQDPAAQDPANKPGSCPPFPTSFTSRIMSCKSHCNSDSDCSGSQKCCPFSSCKRCFVPTRPVALAPVRPSKCPKMPATANLTSCDAMCSSDTQCTNGQICCPYGCSVKCLDPVSDSPILKPGYCPVTPDSFRSFSCFKACESDSNCPGKTKCCGNGCSTRCVDPRQTPPRASRAGYCPANNISSPTTNCESKCSSDYACVQNEKCCYNGCRRECVPSVRLSAARKPGFCPVSTLSRFDSFRSFRLKDCGHYCNSDFSCPGELKCCRQGCKTSCITKQSSPSALMKAGYCPATIMSTGSCVRACNSDLSCRGNQKCCFEGSCSQKCVDPLSSPPTPRPGSCPNVNPLPVNQCQSAREFCNSDHSCPEPLKCCFDGCSNRCINPETSIMSTKEGFCPSFSVGNNEACVVGCTTDDSCTGDQKCCSVGCAVKCVQPERSPPKDKAGFCPFIPTSLSDSCQQLCQLDDSCPGVMKCCQNGCSRKCYNPDAVPQAISKAGYCPSTVANPTCDTPCNSDGSCPGAQKCCQLSCGMSCIDPEQQSPGVKVGFCPFVNPNVSTMCLKTCSSDYACAGDTKCCSFGQCSMRCMEPALAPHPQRKSGDCPSANGARGQPLSIECLSDYACPGQEKCCRIGNAVSCSAPRPDSPPKLGSCPQLRSTSPVCTSRCASDSHCPNDEKCCASGCSSVCVPAIFSDQSRARPGHCPYVEPHVLLACTVNCTSDDECGNEQKCCEYGCGMRCLNTQPFPPTTQKDGQCPNPDVRNPLYSVPGGSFWFLTKERPSRETYGYRNCRNDGQCPGTLKCCASSVGGTECITPI